MTITVENGTGLIDAESYCGVTYADLYHSNRDNSAWALLSLIKKEANLRKATEYMVGKYRLSWTGKRAFTTQSLDWPRIGVVLYDTSNEEITSDTIPTEVKNACADLALKASTGDLLKDRSMKIIEDTVGPITTKFDPKSSPDAQYPRIDSMLSVFFGSGSSPINVRLVRC